MGDIENRWFEVEKDGLPQGVVTCICIVRGATSLRLMKYAPEHTGWTNVSQGGVNKSVTHWHKVPEPPKALWMNILLKKANESGLDDDEKLELAQLLKESI